MNNLLSYCGLVDAKIRASDKDLPVQLKIIYLVSIIKDCDVTKTSDANQGVKLKKRRARHLMDGRTWTRASLLTMAVFRHICKKLSKTNLNFRSQKVNNQKE